MTRLFCGGARIGIVVLVLVGAVTSTTGRVPAQREYEGWRVGSPMQDAQAPAAALAVVPVSSAIDTAEWPAQPCDPAPGFFVTDVATRKIDPVSVRDALVARIHNAGSRFGVVPALGEGIAWTESRFDPSARSPDGLSVGAFQLTRGTAAAMRRRLAGATRGLSLHDEVTLGIGYLRYLTDLFARETVLDRQGNTTIAVADCTERWRFAIAAYNAGEGRVASGQRRAAAAGLDPTLFENVRRFLPPITRRYVDSVLAFATAQVTARASRPS